ncbi:HlyD family efflux transporter periplasmic adaptor subunit [Chromatiaceae bacterium AAb-1]|nr:HlyD family efflux transporter periplasmic adaptor subunit [Chromatiaceae bacterium AAb-1]
MNLPKIALKPIVIIAGVIIVLFIISQKYLFSDALPADIATGNGRVEATEIAISAKTAGRIKEILVNEGDFVAAEQIVAYIDSESLTAQLQQAEAQQRQAFNAVSAAYSQLAQRQSEKAALEAVLAQREAELSAASNRARRTSTLAKTGAASQQTADDDQAQLRSAEAAVAAAKAQIDSAGSGIAAANAQILSAESASEAAEATVNRVKVELQDNVLKAPRAGRIQYRVAQPGEIVGSGGRVLNMIDLTDVYMTFFLPAAQAGRVAIGSEVSIVLDAVPHVAIPAKISYVADVAQFTPKTVETASEREKLMFRVKAQINPELLQKHISQVKTGLPGVAWVKLSADAQWPAHLPERVNP